MHHTPWTPVRVIVHLAVGIGAGFLSGLFGVGGGVVIVPALVLWLGYDQRRAAGTSLAAIVPTASVGVVAYALSGQVDWIAAVVLAAGAIIGAQAGSWLLPRVPVPALQLAFTGVIIVVIVSLFLVIPARDDEIALSVLSGLGLAGLGIATGLLSGLFGIGGGMIVVPALILLFGSGDLAARGTSLLMMIPAAVSGTIGNLLRKNCDLVGAALIGGSACVTTALGAWVAGLIDPAAGNIAFAVFLAAVGCQLAVRAIRTLRAS